MANLKNITDLPVVESAEGLNLIVNDNGSAKQIAASAVGAQADWSVTDETSPAFIKNKPVEEWDLDIIVNVSINTDDESLVYDPILNSGTFDVVKNKILNNDQVKVKSHIVFTSPKDSSIIAHENMMPCCVTYSPQDMYGSGTNPEMVVFLGNSLLGNAMLGCALFPDNTIDVSTM